MNSRIISLILCVATLTTDSASAQSLTPAALPATEASTGDSPQIAPAAANTPSRAGRSRSGSASTRSSAAGAMPGAVLAEAGYRSTWTPHSKELARFPLVHFSQPDARILDALTEDLNVMSFLLEQTVERAVGENSPAYKMGIPMLLNPGTRNVQAVYIEGFGVLFTAGVNFPLLPPPPAKEKEKEAPTGTDDWETARQQLLGHPEAVDMFNQFVIGAASYDAEQTAGFRKALLEALKHAANIRTLKPDEFIVVTVFGADNVATMRNEVALGGAPPSAYAVNATGYITTTTPLTGRDTVLSIRARKSDAEAFARGKLNFDQFEQKATISSYLGAAKTDGTSRGVFYPAGATTAPLAPSVR